MENQNKSIYYNNKGVIYYEEDNYDKAIKYLNKAIGLSPKNDAYYNNRGLVYNKLKDYKKAYEDFNNSIKLNHKNTSAYKSMELACYKLKEQNELSKDLNNQFSLNILDKINEEENYYRHLEDDKRERTENEKKLFYKFWIC